MSALDRPAVKAAGAWVFFLEARHLGRPLLLLLLLLLIVKYCCFEASPVRAVVEVECLAVVFYSLLCGGR